jgi:poly-gamma-glutamate system protein
VNVRNVVYRPRGGAWPVNMAVLSLAAVVVFGISTAVSWRPSLVDSAPRDLQAKARLAESTMRRAALVIRDARRLEGIASEADDGSVMSALLGAELTPITTTLGNLEAKRIATKPAWASALVLRLDRAGLRAGDVVAAGLSGSFPGLDLALVAACQALDLRLVAVSSVTASSWGANQPGFTWPEIEARLVRAGVIRRSTVAVSTGGADDRAADLEPDGRAEALRIAEAVGAQLGVPVLRPTNFERAIVLHLNSYNRAAAGRPIRLFANVGGAEASLGRSAAVLRLRNGFLPGVPFDLSPNRGVLARFAERGVPVLTLLNVRDLALRWGIL